MDIWLPREAHFEDMSFPREFAEIRVLMKWDINAGKTKLKVNSKLVENLNELEEAIQENINDFRKYGKSILLPDFSNDFGAVPVIIDAYHNVPWQDVVSVIDICKKLKIGVEFASPMPESAFNFDYPTYYSSNGGGGGRFGGRFGGKENLVKRGGGTRKSLEAMIEGLLWLARHQNSDGSWSAKQFSKNCSGTQCSGPGSTDYDVGVTGLSLLAFLGAGYTHTSADTFVDPVLEKKVVFGEVVKKGIEWLLKAQGSDGCIGKKVDKYVYNHTIAAMVLIETYGMTLAPRVRAPAQKAIDFIIQAQNPGKGWRYTTRSGDNDSSVTGWCVMALEIAELSGLDFSETAYHDALAWYNEVTDKDGRVSYDRKEKSKVSPRTDKWDEHETCTAIGMLARIIINKNISDTNVSNGAIWMLKDLPKWQDHKVDYYHWYWGTLAMFQYDGPDGPNWRKWNKATIDDAIMSNQHSRNDGCAGGSWDPEADRWGFEGGRVYATAINILTLETYYRFPRFVRIRRE